MKPPAGPVEADPLLAALIGKLPLSGASWSIEKRSAWLELMWKAFGVVYEGGEVTELPAFLRVVAGAGPKAQSAPIATSGAAMPAPAPGAPREPAEYIIDINGYLKRTPDGARITFNDIPAGETLWDERPERNRHDDVHAADGDWPVEAIPNLSIATR